MKSFGFYMPTRVFFGEGSVSRLSRAPLPAGLGLLITGGTSTTRLGYVEKVTTALREGGRDCIVYDKVQPNPTIEGVRECAALAREKKCSFIIGLGGGSAIDTAKAASIMAVNDGDWWDYVFGGTGGGKRIAQAGLPLVAVPTTAGTGTEADPWTVISNGEEKIGAGGDKTFPALSVIDPELMLSVPPHLTAYQGFDALFHACEGYIATCATPFSEPYSLQSIERIGASLAQAVRHGDDRAARADVALASTLAGFVETLSSCAGQHAIAHALGALHPELPHGAGLIMLSKAYFSRFLSDCPEKFIRMAKALGRENASEPHDFIEMLGALMALCNVDHLSLADYHVDTADLGRYADNAQDTMGGLFQVDPHRLSREDVIAILRDSCR